MGSQWAVDGQAMTRQWPGNGQATSAQLLVNGHSVLGMISMAIAAVLLACRGWRLGFKSVECLSQGRPSRALRRILTMDCGSSDATANRQWLRHSPPSARPAIDPGWPAAAAPRWPGPGWP